MHPQSRAEPVLKTVHAALRKTTETLALELAQPGTAAPDWSEFEWLVARAVAAMHGISPLLSLALRWQGPVGWARFLSEQREHTAYRYQRIQDLLQLLDRRSRYEGIALVSLKGAALHGIGIYAAGERPMADIDLLVRQKDAQRTVAMLEALGFHESHATWKHRVFEPNDPQPPAGLGENAHNAMKIELHTRICEILPQRVADVSELIFPQRPHAGLNNYQSNASLMIHLLLHAAGAMVTRALRLVNLHDISRLSARMTDNDWNEVLLQRASCHGPFWWAFPPLALTARYNSSIPDRVLAALAEECPWTLKQTCRRRTLSEVSFSHLWISAFPGIEWTHSMREMLAYAARRVLPSAEVRALRTVNARTQPCAAESKWAHMAQSRRLLHWMTSRQPRAETLRPVRMALGQPP